jgi:peptidoglycan/LPS O-acetylase OafA/YrhL
VATPATPARPPRAVRSGDGGRLHALDGLRFLAAAGVVAFHFTGRNGPAWGQSTHEVFPSLSGITAYGFFGPYLFFMISGFVVLMSAEGRSAPAFLASRVGRLYPAYWVAVLITALVLHHEQQLLPVWPRLHLAGVVLNLTMFQTAFGVDHVDGVYWTLWVEWKFYLLVIGLLLVAMTRRRLLLLCLAWPLGATFALQAHADVVAGLLEPTYAPFFCIGILLYLVHRDGWSPAVALLLACDVAFATWSCWAYCVPWLQQLVSVPVSSYRIFAVFALSLAGLVAVTLTPLARIRWRWLSTLGALTYPLYLLHEVTGWVLIHHLAPRTSAHVAVVVTVTALLGASWAVHRLVERPLGPRLRRALERDLLRVVPAAPAPALPSSAVHVPGPPAPGSGMPLPRPAGTSAMPRLDGVLPRLAPRRPSAPDGGPTARVPPVRTGG